MPLRAAYPRPGRARPSPRRIIGVWMGDVEAGHGGARPHRIALGGLVPPTRRLGLRRSNSVASSGRAARDSPAPGGCREAARGPDPREKRPRRAHSPRTPADQLVHPLGERFGEAVGEGLTMIERYSSLARRTAGRCASSSDTGRHHETADIVRRPPFGATKSETHYSACRCAAELLAQAVEGAVRPVRASPE